MYHDAWLDPWALQMRVEQRPHLGLDTTMRDAALFRNLVISAVIGLVFWFYLWTASSSANPFLITKRPLNYYQQYYGSEDRFRVGNYYSMLSDAFLSGRLSLLLEPRKELLDIPNPYDSSANKDLRFHDASLYEGKYYLAWGPAPALALFIPFRLIFGKDMPENLAAALFCFWGFVSIGFMLYGCMFNLAISLTGYGYFDSLRSHNPQAYQRIEKVFIPLQRLVAKYLTS